MIEYDPLLYGTDDEARIVGLHRVGDKMRVYKRTEEDEVVYDDRTFHEFLHLTDEAYEIVSTWFSRQNLKHALLRGDGVYRHLVSLPSTWEARTLLEGTDVYEQFTGEGYHYVGAKEIQYLIQTGKTLFKGMKFAELHRLSFDLEVISPQGGFPLAHRESDEIVIISVRDNRGLEVVLHTHPEIDKKNTARGTRLVRYPNEKALLEALVLLIESRDPDVIENHNIFGFDLPYLRDRANLLNVYLGLGRDGREPYTYERSVRFAEKEVEIENFIINGRAVIDTMFLAMSWDVFNRKLESYGLKYVAQEFGVAPEDRTYIDGQDLTWHWFNDAEPMLDYAIDDVIEVQKVSEMLSGSTFYVTQMVPMDYQRTGLSGTGSKIESLFVRHYIHEREALPEPERGWQEGGGYTGTKHRGLYRHCIYADVESLYPSIMLNFNIQPERETLGLFPKILQQLTDLRFESKHARNNSEEGSQQYAELDARQQSYKELINSFYGVLSFKYGLFNDYSEGERVARVGRKILRTMMAEIERLGHKVVLFDTDGVMLTTGERYTHEQQMEIINRLTEVCPEGITIGHDGEYESVLAYKPKNYVLRTYDGKLKIKGNSLKSRGYERYITEYMERLFVLFMEEDFEAVRKLYNDVRARVQSGEWDVRDFERRNTIHKSYEEYQFNIRDSGWRGAVYEVAYMNGNIDREVSEGDSVRYYISHNDDYSRNWEKAKSSSIWVKGDEDTAYYLGRVDTVTGKFDVLFTEEDFGKVFDPITSQERLFSPPSLSNVRIHNQPLPTDE